MNKKISQFELTNTLREQDLITLVQGGKNRNIASGTFTTELANTFATNEQVSSVNTAVTELNSKVTSNYTDLSNKIAEGDSSVTTNLNSTITSYYDVLNNKIITLDTKHDTDITEINGTVQDWIDDIDKRSTLEQLQDALNRLTVAENTITALADVIANGGGSGSAPGYHTQSTATIFPLSGYYKSTDNSPLASTDTLNQALSKLEKQIESVSSTSDSLPLIKTGESTPPTDKYLYTAGKVKQDYIYKSGDTVPGRIIYTTGIQGGSTFRSGWDGVGASLYPTNSKWNLELDNLMVRGNMTVNELTVNEIKAVGGDILVTLADMKVIKVETTESGYKCYFDTEDNTKYNEFLVNDQVICQKFDGSDVKRYWRAVTAVGEDFIVLSKDICEAGSGTPTDGDTLILLGHRVEGDAEYNEQMEDRRNAIFISSKGSNAPRIAFYSGIDNFTLEGKDKTVIGKDSKFVGTISVVSKDGTESGIPFYRGPWSADKNYYYYDYVTYNGSAWIANADNINQEPSSNSIYWSIYIAKGDDGKTGDDVAKWVEITGSRMFLYNTPDYTGTPTPPSLGLMANVYGIANPSYEWKDSALTSVGFGAALTITPNMLSSRTEIFKCTVKDNDTGSTYYDETQVAKLANGAEGLDAYYIDLTNYSASVPFNSEGTISVDPTTIYTNVFAYHGIEPIVITSITAETVEGNCTVGIEDNKVYLKTLLSTSANVKLTITVADGMVVTKNWYINKSKDGESGFNGEDAITTALTTESNFFHYTEYATVPTPETITLTMTTNLLSVSSYAWYWKVAGTSTWNLIQGEVTSTLVVSHNGSYFNNENEITFRCLLTSTNGDTFEDSTTINKVRDGESVYRGALEGESITVPANYAGVVSDWSQAKTNAFLKRGSTTFTNTEYTLTSTQITGVGTLSIDQEKKLISINSTSIPDNYITVQWKIGFVHDGEERDSVIMSLVKNITGKDGDLGNSSIQIYTNTNSTPTRPTFTEMLNSSGASSGGFAWYPDPTNSITTLTWSSTGYYNPNTSKMDLLPDGSGYRWTKPIIYSPLNGVDGSTGKGITSVQTQYNKSTSPTSQDNNSWSNTNPGAENGYWIWTRLLITYTDGTTSTTNAVCSTGAAGSDGDYGPGLSYRGEYSNTKTYGWTSNTNGNVRDIVYYSGYYFAVNKYRKGLSVFSNITPTDSYGSDGSNYYWTRFNSFENVATGLLFAVKATIAGWDFYNDRIQSGGGNVLLDGRAYNSSTSAGLYPLSIGTNAVSSPSSGVFRVDKDGNMTATSGSIGGFTVDSRSIKNLNVSLEDINSSKTKFAIADQSTISDAKYMVSFGSQNSFYVPTDWTVDENFMYTGVGGILKDARTYSGKKTAWYVECSGATTKNTAMAVHGNMTVSGDFARCGYVLGNALPSKSSGFDRNVSIMTKTGTYYLPTSEYIRDWFGTNPNHTYLRLQEQAYELFVATTIWTGGNVIIRGNPSGNNSDSYGTGLFGSGVDRTSYASGQVVLTPGKTAHFLKSGAYWYLINVA